MMSSYFVWMLSSCIIVAEDAEMSSEALRRHFRTFGFHVQWC